jgi:uncharacterized membrane protein YkvA (DUF1232 family)
MFEQIISLAKRIKQELAFYRRVAQHVGKPWLAKVCLGLAIGYLLLPFDLIPDFIPILGQLDDFVIVPLLVYLALTITPKTVIDSCRQAIN